MARSEVLVVGKGTGHVRVRFKRATSAEWMEFNPVLAYTEVAFDTETLVMKIGDGRTNWVLLPPATLEQLLTLMGES